MPRTRGAQRRDERDADDGEHEELGRAEGQHQRPHHGDRDGEGEGADDCSDERGGERGAERPPGLALLGHRVAVEDGGGARRFAGDAEQHRGDVAGGGDHGVHAEQERERLRPAASRR